MPPLLIFDVIGCDSKDLPTLPSLFKAFSAATLQKRANFFVFPPCCASLSSRLSGWGKTIHPALNCLVPEAHSGYFPAVSNVSQLSLGWINRVLDSRHTQAAVCPEKTVQTTEDHEKGRCRFSSLNPNWMGVFILRPVEGCAKTTGKC